MKKKPVTIDAIVKDLAPKAKEFFLVDDLNVILSHTQELTDELKALTESGEIVHFRVNENESNILTLVRHDETYRLNRTFLVGDKSVTSVDIEAHSLEDLAIKLMNKI